MPAITTYLHAVENILYLCMYVGAYNFKLIQVAYHKYHSTENCTVDNYNYVPLTLTKHLSFLWHRPVNSLSVYQTLETATHYVGICS